MLDEESGTRNYLGHTDTETIIEENHNEIELSLHQDRENNYTGFLDDGFRLNAITTSGYDINNGKCTEHNGHLLDSFCSTCVGNH